MITVLDFTAAWCVGCKQIAPVLRELKTEYEGQLQVEEVNVDDGDARVMKHRVMSLPTLVILAGGEEVDRLTGARSRVVIREFIKAYIGR